MKPAPKLDRPVAQTTGTTRLHFDHLTRKYGPQVSSLGTGLASLETDQYDLLQTIINLAETSGKEGSVTLGYRDVVKDLDDKDVRYVEFDFHHECELFSGKKRDHATEIFTL